MITGTVSLELDLASLVESAPSHNGERFSGWTPTYDVAELGVSEVIDSIGEEHSLGQRYEQALWVNVLKGRGAEVEEHTEGYNTGDNTVLLFLSDLDSDEGGKLIVGDQVFTPKIGHYIVFPSDTPHSVTALNTDKPRISVAGIFHG